MAKNRDISHDTAPLSLSIPFSVKTANHALSYTRFGGLIKTLRPEHVGILWHQCRKPNHSPSTASPRPPPGTHRATNHTLSSFQIATHSRHCYWLCLGHKRAVVPVNSAWHSWLVWAYDSGVILTDL